MGHLPKKNENLFVKAMAIIVMDLKIRQNWTP